MRQSFVAAEHLSVPGGCFGGEWPDPLSKQFADQGRDRHRSLELEPQRTVRLCWWPIGGHHRQTDRSGAGNSVASAIRPSVVALVESGVAEVVASQVSVRNLKTHLSQWLARARSGEVVEVTSHRQPIARITAVKPAHSGITSPLQQAIDAGLISWNGQKPNLPPPVKLRGQGRLLSDIVLEDRG